MNLGLTELILLVVWLVPVALVLVALVGNRPGADRFFAVNDLPDTGATRALVARTLTRIRRSQRVGAATGFALGGATGLGTSLGFGVAGAALGLLAGTMLGTANAAVAHCDDPPEGGRRAELVPREIGDYLPRRAQLTLGLTALAVVVTVAVAIAATPNGFGVTFVFFTFAVATLATIPLARRAQRRTLEARRTDLDPAAVRVDDALRACAIRAIHHATVGVLLCGLLLAAYGLVATQNVTDVIVDGHVAVHVPPLADDIRFVPLDGAGHRLPDPAVGPSRWRISWTPVAAAREARVVRGQRIRLDSTGLTALTSLGVLTTWLAFAGALVEYSRASKAWRRPQRSPSAVVVPGSPRPVAT